MTQTDRRAMRRGSRANEQMRIGSTRSPVDVSYREVGFRAISGY
jgi:hypothetical protein